MTLLTKTINDYLLNNVLSESVDAIYNDIFPTAEGNCLISRHDPSQAKVIEYIDGSSEGVLEIAYYMRSSDASVCRQVLNLVIDKTDNLSLTDSDGTEIYCEAVTLPNFLSVDDKDQCIYTATIQASFKRAGN